MTGVQTCALPILVTGAGLEDTAGMEGALYSSTLPQQGGGLSGVEGAAGGAISLEGFEASFGSQFSDLINDFISVEGGGGGAAGGGARTHSSMSPTHRLHLPCGYYFYAFFCIKYQTHDEKLWGSFNFFICKK